MTTRDPGASEVLTQGLDRSPRSTARLARRPAPIITWGLEVLVQLVIAAITTSPSWTSLRSGPLAVVSAADRRSRPRPDRNAWAAPESDTRSWGRDGPARLGTTVARSSSTV